jgi:hypothetical protein
MGIVQTPKGESRPPVRQNASKVSADALGTKKIQTPEEVDRPPDCAELKYAGIMAEV